MIASSLLSLVTPTVVESAFDDTRSSWVVCNLSARSTVARMLAICLSTSALSATACWMTSASNCSIWDGATASSFPASRVADWLSLGCLPWTVFGPGFVRGPDGSFFGSISRALMSCTALCNVATCCCSGGVGDAWRSRRKSVFMDSNSSDINSKAASLRVISSCLCSASVLYLRISVCSLSVSARRSAVFQSASVCSFWTCFSSWLIRVVFVRSYAFEWGVGRVSALTSCNRNTDSIAASASAHADGGMEPLVAA